MPAVKYAHAAAAPPKPLHAANSARGVKSLARHILGCGGTASTPLNTRDLEPRQGTVAIPTVYAGLNSGPSPGVVVGATLGAVAGFLLLVWLFSAISSNNNNWGGSVTQEEVVYRPSRSRRTRREMRSVSRPRTERVIRQERIVRESSRAPAPVRGSFVAGEADRRVEGDDVVEVFEEEDSVESAAPRRQTRRSGGGYRRH